MRFPSRDIPLEHLRLDDENPRLPESLHQASQSDILGWMVDEGVLEELAISFLTHGYLEHEPIFVLAGDDDEWIVLEGNRRLAALMVLTQQPAAQEDELTFRLAEEPSRDQLDRLQVIPARVVANREEVREFVGFRHIGGLKEWPPEAKARWIETEVARRDGAGNVFAEIARAVGTNAQSIRGPYLALRILRHALQELDDMASVRHVQRHRFGVLVRATNSPDLRHHLAPSYEGTPRTLADVDEFTEALDVGRLHLVLEDLVPPAGKRQAVLSDSRDVTKYARALDHPVASRVLREYMDLELAAQILEHENIPHRIKRLADSVHVILEEIQRDLQPIPDGTSEATRQLYAAVDSLQAQVEHRATTPT